MMKRRSQAARVIAILLAVGALIAPSVRPSFALGAGR